MRSAPLPGDRLTLRVCLVVFDIVSRIFVVGRLGHGIAHLICRNERLADIGGGDLEAIPGPSAAGEDAEAWIAPGGYVDGLVTVLFAHLVQLWRHGRGARQALQRKAPRRAASCREVKVEVWVGQRWISAGVTTSARCV